MAFSSSARALASDSSRATTTMMMADDNDDDDFWAQQGDLIDQMVANHERERQTQQQQHQQQPEPPTNSTPHAALSFDNPSSSVRSLPAGSRPEASPPHAPLRTFVVGADDGDPSMPQAARILLHEVTHIEVGPYAHRGQEAAKLVGRWLLERARAHQFHAAPKPKPRPLSAISANGSAGTTTQSSGGLDDVPSTLPSGQSSRQSRPGTKCPVRGIPHFDSHRCLSKLKST